MQKLLKVSKMHMSDT